MWQVRRVEETGSTNVDVAELARSGAAEGTAVVAGYQRTGRGRLDRTWEAPPGSSLAVSFLLRPRDVPVERWPWLPLLVGVAAVDAVVGLTGVGAKLKWPNDVLVDERKLAGILVERVDTPQGAAAVAGIGLNVTQRRDQLPPTATSLFLEGAAGIQPAEMLEALGDRLAERYAEWHDHRGDPAAGIAPAYRQRCATLGRQVRVEFPGSDAAEGVAADIDDTGRLVLQTGTERRVIGAGDIVHLRPV
ncbi:biotin--[acetyl-CoA-carboxylase] ligase [Phytoactinopolyspora mesophila]|uniref:biotin--[biotin carboxyl-carrier protein] ligase n=1 Tax=Phytoactinopolyspora mesophila TaxID=2650750 RepID=A0A7K3M9F5_9ACTN|nr:biotin--[acetyl-CoA-carboxylase] ligase [Phytoactinopolyspora mesophila]NDL59913.1 biotin--[acetyl-CoA-carboxylase] ligase [Phytoactinopolyspora mesophila]